MSGFKSDLASSEVPQDYRTIELLNHAAELIRTGAPLPWDDWLKTYPDQVEQVRSLVAVIEKLSLLHSESSANAPSYDIEPPNGAGQFGDFLLRQEIGRGGMGVVYEALQRSLGRLVALKVLPLATLLEGKQLARFRNEAHAAALLEHPHIVPVYGVGEEQGVHYYAMRLIRGRSLADWIAQARQEFETTENSDESNSTAIPFHSLPAPAVTEKLREATELIRQAAEALSYAHQRGIIHRDIKPSNLLVEANGHLWVTDFGLAQVEGGTQLTMTGELLGTLRYMSPEQLQGDKGFIDHRTDVYSLGLTLYEMLTLCAANTGHSRGEVVHQILNKQPPLPRQLNRFIPHDLETIVLKAISKQPADRYATAADLAADLQSYLRGQTIMARRPTAFDRLSKWSRRHRRLVLTGILLLSLISIAASVTAVVVWQQRSRLAKALVQANQQTREARFQSSRLAVARALAMCRDGDIGQGLTWFVRGLKLCPADEHDFRRVIRANLDSWSAHIHPLTAFVQHPSALLSATFTGDGRYVITGAQDDHIRVWDAHACALIHDIQVNEPKRWFWALATHPTSSHVAAGSTSGRIYIINAETGEIDRQWQAHSGGVWQLDFSPDGRQLVSCSEDHTSRIWSVGTASAVSPPLVHEHPVRAVVFGPDSRSIFTSALGDSRVFEWHGSDSLERRILLDTREDTVIDFEWLDDQHLALACENGVTRIWNHGAKVIEPPRLSHLASPTAIDAGTSGALMISAGRDQAAKIWEWREGKLFGSILNHSSNVTALAFSSPTQAVVTGTDSQRLAALRFWKTASPPPTSPVLPELRLNSKYAVSPSGKLFGIAEDNRVHRWDQKSGSCEMVFEGSSEPFALSPDGTCLIVANTTEVICFDAQSGGQLWQHECHDVPALVTFSNSGAMVAVTYSQPLVLNANTGEVLSTMTEAPAFVRAVAFSEDDQWIGVGSIEGEVQIHEAQTGRQIGPMMSQGYTICDLRFGPANRTLFSASRDGQIHWWDCMTHRALRAPTTLQMMSKDIRILPNCGWAIAVGGDGMATIFDLATGWPISAPIQHRGDLYNLAFMNNGQTLVTQRTNGQLEYCPVPQECNESLEELKWRVERMTGLALGENEQVVHLSPKQWRELGGRFQPAGKK